MVQIWPGQTVTCLHTISPGHIWTTLYIQQININATLNCFAFLTARVHFLHCPITNISAFKQNKKFIRRYWIKPGPVLKLNTEKKVQSLLQSTSDSFTRIGYTTTDECVKAIMCIAKFRACVLAVMRFQQPMWRYKAGPDPVSSISPFNFITWYSVTRDPRGPNYSVKHKGQ